MHCCGKAYNHPEVEIAYGLYKEYSLVHSKIIFHLLQDGCSSEFIDPPKSCPRAQEASRALVRNYL